MIRYWRIFLENKTKAETFIGFAIRAKKHRIGMNAIKTLKKIDLLIVCDSASENSKNEAQKLAKKYHCPLLITKTKSLEQLTHRENSKIMAVSDKALSKAILDNSENDFYLSEN